MVQKEHKLVEYLKSELLKMDRTVDTLINQNKVVSQKVNELDPEFLELVSPVVNSDYTPIYTFDTNTIVNQIIKACAGKPYNAKIVAGNGTITKSDEPQLFRLENLKSITANEIELLTAFIQNYRNILKNTGIQHFKNVLIPSIDGLEPDTYQTWSEPELILQSTVELTRVVPKECRAQYMEELSTLISQTAAYQPNIIPAISEALHIGLYTLGSWAKQKKVAGIKSAEAITKGMVYLLGKLTKISSNDTDLDSARKQIWALGNEMRENPQIIRNQKKASAQYSTGDLSLSILTGYYTSINKIIDQEYNTLSPAEKKAKRTELMKTILQENVGPVLGVVKPKLPEIQAGKKYGLKVLQGSEVIIVSFDVPNTTKTSEEIEAFNLLRRIADQNVKQHLPGSEHSSYFRNTVDSNRYFAKKV